MTRLLRTPRRVRVVAEEHLPRAVEVGGKMERVELLEAWRVSEPWWPEPIDRDYAKVAGPNWMLVLFRDRQSGEWFIERVID